MLEVRWPSQIRHDGLEVSKSIHEGLFSSFMLDVDFFSVFFDFSHILLVPDHMFLQRSECYNHHPTQVRFDLF